jgi:hypothetical protein
MPVFHLAHQLAARSRRKTSCIVNVRENAMVAHVCDDGNGAGVRHNIPRGDGKRLILAEKRGLNFFFLSAATRVINIVRCI